MPDATTPHALHADALRHHHAGALAEAETLYRRALAHDPVHADSLYRLGVLAQQRGQGETAVDLIGQAIAANGGVAEYHANLGIALARLESLDAAITSYRRALMLQPDFAAAHYNLGNALRRRGQPEQAVGCYRRALALMPNDQAALNNLGNALQDLRDLTQAEACFRQALTLRPELPQAHLNLAAVLREQGRLSDSAACSRAALALRPDLPEAHYALAMALLPLGEFAEGWPAYEWRWHTPALRQARRNFAQPQWRGEPAAGRTLLLHAEQGLGDTLQFCRYATLAAAGGLRVVLEVQAPLVRLLQGLPRVSAVVARGEALPPFDLHCPLLSLPLALGTTLLRVPAASAYLRADPAAVAGWRARLGPERLVGLAWAGNPRQHAPSGALIDRRRSLAPERLRPLFSVPGVRFVSLQKDGPRMPADVALLDPMPEMTDVADTAAVVANLDLVISVDTAVAHLGAALGKPVWLLDRFDHCWRWLAGQAASPWYPSLRIYRQMRPGDWDGVIADVVRELRRVWQ